jgi:hypothetical protein
MEAYSTSVAALEKDSQAAAEGESRYEHNEQFRSNLSTKTKLTLVRIYYSFGTRIRFSIHKIMIKKHKSDLIKITSHPSKAVHRVLRAAPSLRNHRRN